MEVGLVPAGARPSRQLSLPADRLLLSLFGFRPLPPPLYCRFYARVVGGGGCNTCIPWFLLPFFGSRQGLVRVLRGGVISQGGLCSPFRQPSVIFGVLVDVVYMFDVLETFFHEICEVRTLFWSPWQWTFTFDNLTNKYLFRIKRTEMIKNLQLRGIFFQGNIFKFNKTLLF